ncbi:UDP-glucose 4-epimerase, partial [Haemophilus influenzae]
KNDARHVELAEK